MPGRFPTQPFAVWGAGWMNRANPQPGVGHSALQKVDDDCIGQKPALARQPHVRSDVFEQPRAAMPCNRLAGKFVDVEAGQRLKPIAMNAFGEPQADPEGFPRTIFRGQ